MLNKNSQLHYRLERLSDAGIAVVALSLATAIRRELTNWRPSLLPLPVFDFWPQAGWLYILLVVIWIALYQFFNFYTYKPVYSSRRMFGLLVRINALGVMLSFFTFYLLRIKDIPRVLIILYAIINLLLMWFKELLMRRFQSRWASSPCLLLIGQPSEFAGFLDRIQSLRLWKPQFIGLLTPTSVPPTEALPASSRLLRSSPALEGIPHLGSTDQLTSILHQQTVDTVILSPGQERFDEIQKIITLCETEGVESWLMGSLFNTSIAKAQVDEFQDFPLLIFSTTPTDSWALLVKRLIDVVGSLFLVILTAPVMAAVALATKLTSRGPIIFKQRRCSLHGREFSMYKFRTMVNEAEQLRDELRAKNEVVGPVFKIKDDPRVTRIGRFLRRYSLDELPQLFNVLKGDMSLVGPRPPIPSEVNDYQDWQRRRLSMRPGLTCIWQTVGRNSVNFEDWMKLDLQYIDNWSLSLDLKILLRTPRVVLRGTGL